MPTRPSSRPDDSETAIVPTDRSHTFNCNLAAGRSAQALAARRPTGETEMPTPILTGALRGFVVAASAALAFSMPVAAIAQEHEFAGPLTEIANGMLREIAQNPVVIAAIKAQNEQSAAFDQAKIDQLDSQWRAEVGAASKPLIDATLASDASQALLQAQEQSAGLITEIFVMDAVGLNVAQSTVTSDYWQGDEDKFTLSFGAGPDAVNLGEIEQDESTQTFQSQVSVTITDPADGKPIGAVTAGVDLSSL